MASITTVGASRVGDKTLGSSNVYAALLRDLTAKNLARNVTEKGIGGPLTAKEVEANLAAGKPVAILMPHVGMFSDWIAPDAMSYYTGKDFEKTRGWAMQKLAQQAVVTVTAPKDVERLNAAEKLTSNDTSSSLTPEEKKACAILNRFEGGWRGKLTRVIVTPESSDHEHYYQGSSGNKKAASLYDVKTNRRLVTLNALDHLLAGNAVLVVDHSGKKHTVATLAQLNELPR